MGPNSFCHKTVFLSVLNPKFQVYFTDEIVLKILISRKLIKKMFFLFLLTLPVTILVSTKIAIIRSAETSSLVFNSIQTFFLLNSLVLLTPGTLIYE